MSALLCYFVLVKLWEVTLPPPLKTWVTSHSSTGSFTFSSLQSLIKSSWSLGVLTSYTAKHALCPLVKE